jgi:hypothetical protein
LHPLLLLLLLLLLLETATGTQLPLQQQQLLMCLMHAPARADRASSNCCYLQHPQTQLHPAHCCQPPAAAAAAAAEGDGPSL